MLPDAYLFSLLGRSVNISDILKRLASKQYYIVIVFGLEFDYGTPTVELRLNGVRFSW